MSETTRPLTTKRKLFVAEYLIHGNATRAAIAAGYSANSAASIGSELLAMPNVKAAIEARQAERAAELGITRDRVLEGLAQTAFPDLSRYVTQGESGRTRLDFPRLIREQPGMIAGLTFDAVGDGDGEEDWKVKRLRLRPPDRRSALIGLAKRLGLLNEQAPVAAAQPDAPMDEAAQEFSGATHAPSTEPAAPASGAADAPPASQEFSGEDTSERAPSRKMKVKREAQRTTPRSADVEASVEVSGNGRFHRAPFPARRAGEGWGGGGAKRRKGPMPSVTAFPSLRSAPTPILPRFAGEGGRGSPNRFQEFSGNRRAAAPGSAPIAP